MKVKFKKHYFRRAILVFLASLLSIVSGVTSLSPVLAESVPYKIVLTQESGAILAETEYTVDTEKEKEIDFWAIIVENGLRKGDYSLQLYTHNGAKRIFMKDFSANVTTTDEEHNVEHANWNINLEVRNAKNQTIAKTEVHTTSNGTSGQAKIKIKHNDDGSWGIVTRSGDEAESEERTVTESDIAGTEGENDENDTLDLDESVGHKTILKKCKDKVGILGLGWLLCPLTLSAAEAVNDLYKDIQKNYMNVRPSLFGDELSTTWGTFRDWANLIFIVLFFIVIISQLTGFGIDNYGIKRILPRIIVGAILINLSYIVCQLAIDVSNIIGSGLLGFLDPGSGGGGPATDYIPIKLGGGEVRISIQGLNTGTLIVILLCLVIALLSTIILWVFCLVRDIGIVVATCLSPIAFAANLLPNTEGFYKKWFSLVKILLILYPICALTVGAGSLVSHILSGIDPGWLMQLAAVLAATLPFVAIPYLLLNMLSAFGTIGNKLAGLGRRTITAGAAAGLAGRGIKQAYKNSNFAYNRQENKAHKIDMKRVNQAKRVSSRLSRQDPAELSNRQRERLARANQTIDKDNERQSAVNYASSAGYLERRAQGREDMERRKREEDVMAQITNGSEFRDERGNPIDYRRGTDINAMNNRLIALLNMGDRATAAQVTERGALIRQMARTKGGDKKLAMLAYDRNLNDTGIATFNNHRLQNSDVSSVIAGKNSVGTALLNDLAAGRAERIRGANGEYEIIPYSTNDDGSLNLSAGHPVRAGDQEFSRYVSGVLANTNDIASQSTGAINRYGSMLPEAQVRELVNNPQFETLVPDYEKRQALLNTPTIRQQNIEQNQQAMNEARDREQTRIFEEQQSQYERRVAQENEVFRVQEENSRNDTRGTVQQNINGTTHNVYRIPRWQGGFTGNNGTWSINNNNEAIYTEGNLSWNGTTGRINNLHPRQAPTPPPAPGSQPDVQGPPRPPRPTQ